MENNVGISNEGNAKTIMQHGYTPTRMVQTRIWRNWNSHIVLVGVEIGTISMENWQFVLKLYTFIHGDSALTL